MNEEYEKALNESFNACHNLPKDTYGQIPAGYSKAFNYGYTFGMQQAIAEQKDVAESQQNFQREHIATAAMQGLLGSSVWMKAILREANPDEGAANDTDVMPLIASKAVAIADALINELNKPKDENND